VLGFASKSDFRSVIEQSLASNDLETALRKVEQLVERIFCEPLNTAVIFGDRFLDETCQRIGQIRRANVVSAGRVPSSPLPGREPSGRVVYIASKLQASGGHTAVLADIARLSGGAGTVLVTGVGGSTNRQAIQHRFSGISDFQFEFAPISGRLKKLDWLQRRLQELSPSVVWLLNHHQDSVAVAAVQPDQGYALNYLHHGDHNLCLGVFLDYGEHFDPHPMGFHNCRHVLSIPTNKYLPLVVKDLGYSSKPDTVRQHGPLVTCTAARRNKIEKPYWLSYADVIPEILRQTKGRHIHIGKLSLGFRLRIWRNLKRAGIDPASFVYIPYVNSVWQALHDHAVDIYLASFPYGGARTLVEVLGAGVPISIHSHSSKRFLSALDMAPEGALIWREPGDLIELLGRQSSESLAELSAKARLHYERFHSESALKNVLEGSSCELPSPTDEREYRIDQLRQALDIAHQVTLSGVAMRHALRLVRRLKTMMGGLPHIG
jgi:hypothetical protein